MSPRLPVPKRKRTPRAPARARLPLLRFRPGGVGLDGATWGAGNQCSGCGREVRALGTPEDQVGYGEPPAATAEGEPRRIRLVAYGARLESVLGASPRGFESPILRIRSRPSAAAPGTAPPSPWGSRRGRSAAGTRRA